MLLLNPLPQRLDTGATPTFAGITGTNGQTITGNASGAWAIAANGTNQNITLTPSGTGGIVLATANSSYVTIGSNPFAFATASANVLLCGTANDNLIFRNRLDSAEYMRLSGGKLLLGTPTDSANGILQLAAHTTSAGGIGFGTDVSVYRSAAGQTRLESTTTNCRLILRASNSTSVFGLQLEIDSGNAGYLYNTQNAALLFGTNNTNALTLDTSQNATFNGTIKPQLATTAGAPAYVKGALYFDTTLNKLRVGGAAAWETITSA